MQLLISLAAAAAMLLSPLSTQHAPKTITYRTAYHQVQPVESAGEVVGNMRLTFYPDGTVNGTYRNEFGGAIHTVAGGVNGTHLWLSLGMRGRRVQGTINKDGTIVGTLTDSRGPIVYKFTAVPATS